MTYLPGVFIMGILAVLFLIIALVLILGKNPEILHTYHWKNVKEEYKKTYSIQMGIGMLISFITNTAGALINYFTKTNWGWLSFGIGLLSSFVYWTYIQKKYNGGFF